VNSAGFRCSNEDSDLLFGYLKAGNILTRLLLSLSTAYVIRFLWDIVLNWEVLSWSIDWVHLLDSQGHWEMKWKSWDHGE